MLLSKKTLWLFLCATYDCVVNKYQNKMLITPERSTSNSETDDKDQKKSMQEVEAKDNQKIQTGKELKLTEQKL